MFYAPNSLFKNKIKALALLTFSAFLVSSQGAALAAEPSQKEAGAKPVMPQQPAPKVYAIQVAPQNIPELAEAMGRVVAKDLAEIRPQVTGIVLSKNFVEGSRVEKNQVLYQIDDESYRAAYESALASVSAAKSTLENAKLTVKRNQRIVKINAISEQDVDNSIAAQNTAEAQVLVAQATLKNAEINLERTQIRSPIGGVIGRSFVMPGALVTANQASALALVQDLNQVYVDFSVPSSVALKLQSTFQMTQQWAPVTLKSKASDAKVAGQIILIEQAVNAAKDTVVVRVAFDNVNAQLLPGLFVRGEFQLGEREQVILVPPQALSRDSVGHAKVMLVGADNKAMPQPVTEAGLYEGQWVITQGLKSGDSVITKGLQTLRPGSMVQVEIEAAAAAKPKDEVGS